MAGTHAGGREEARRRAQAQAKKDAEVARLVNEESARIEAEAARAAQQRAVEEREAEWDFCGGVRGGKRGGAWRYVRKSGGMERGV